MMRRIFRFVGMSSATAVFVAFSTLAQDGRSGAPEREFKFEVFSMRPVQLQAGGLQGIPDPTPNGFRTTANLSQMMKFAYGPPGNGMMWLYAKTRNEPSWFGDYYAIEARVSQTDLKAWQSQTRDHELLRSALRAALKERCKLAVHEQPSQEQIFELVVAKGGPKLKAAAPNAPLPVGLKLESGGVATGIGPRGDYGWEYHSATVQDLAQRLSLVSITIPVRDRTGLTGRYDFSVRQAPLQPGEDRVYIYPVDPLGLKLKPGTENGPVLVIDHVEKPAAN